VAILIPSEARRRRALTVAILVAGFGAAIAVYIVNSARPATPIESDPLETKKYIHDLELYGGKANVLAAEFVDWFTGLWSGTNLAYTIAVLTLLAVGAVRFVFALRAAGIAANPPQPPGPRRIPPTDA
jgi:hypothetical protein